MPPINGERFVYYLLIAALVVAALLAAFGVREASSAPPICGLTSNMEATLAVHGEHESAKGPTVGGGLMRLFVTPSGDTWSLILSLGNGRSCLVDAGENWAVSRVGSL
jgi:hypothetical protein